MTLFSILVPIYRRYKRGTWLNLLLLSLAVSIYVAYQQYLSTDYSDNIVSALYKTDVQQSPWPVLTQQTQLSPEQQQQVEQLLGQLSVRSKVEQMLHLQANIDPDNLERFNVGSIRYGNAQPAASRRFDLDEIKQQTIWDNAQAIAAKRNEPFIPPLFSVTAVHGVSHEKDSTVFPHALGIGASDDAQLAYDIAQATAIEAKSYGYHWLIGPYTSLIRDFRLGDSYLYFSEEPQRANKMIKAHFKALKQQGVISSARGFIGQGYGPHSYADFNVEDAVLHNLFASGHITAMQQGAQVVELSYNKYAQQSISENSYLIQQILKQRMQFNGVVMSPLNAQADIGGCWLSSCAKMINAGVDMIYLHSQKNLTAPRAFRAKYYDGSLDFIDNTVKQVEQGDIALSRIDDAVRRVLSLKMQLGLFAQVDADSWQAEFTVSKDQKQQHVNLAAQASAQSSVLLKNNYQLLPFNPQRKLLVIGTAAERLSDQTGAYSNAISFDSASAVSVSRSKKAYSDELNLVSALKNNSDNIEYIDASSLNPQIALSDAQKLFKRLERVKKPPKKLKKAFDGQVNLVEGLTTKDSQLFLKQYSLRINAFMQDFDSIIVVVSEPPFASGAGDKPNLAPSFALQQQLNFLYSVNNPQSRIALVMYAGRPSYIPQVMNLADAMVVSFYPGSNVQGLADLLINKDFKFSASLPVTWPIGPCDINNNLGSANSLTAFDYGYAVSEQNKQEWVNLPFVNDCPKTFKEWLQ